MHKDWTIEQWNNGLWTDESKFEIFSSNRRVYVQRRVVEKVATPVSLQTWTIKDDVNDWGPFANCKVGDLNQAKGKLNQFGISAYCCITQSHLDHGGMWVKDFYWCKIMTQSVLVNSTRGISKAKRNSTSFKWCLVRSRIPLNWCAMNLSKKSELNNPQVRLTLSKSYWKAGQNYRQSTSSLWWTECRESVKQ